MTKPKADIYPVYLIYGPEDFLIDLEVRRLLDRTLSEKERGLNFHLFSGEEESGKEIVQTAQTLPMFSRYRFVLVNDADRVDERKMEELLRYIQNPSPSTCLVLCGQTFGPWKKHQHVIEKVGKVIECGRLKGRALISWVKNRMAEKGKRLSEEAADYLVEVVGDHLYDLDSALEKAFLSVGEKRTVELSDVEGVASDVKVSTVFDLMEAIGHQDLKKALGILEKAIATKTIPFRKEEASKKIDDPVPLLLSMMAKQYRNLWRVKEMASHEKKVAEIVKSLGMSPWSVKRLIEQEGHFSESSLREGILRCHQTDLSIKRGHSQKELLMEKLVIDLCRPR
ncbi:MAG: DNA polymerase III subunit delta [Syntrophaceae bacterium]|nr:DNA polymerase III subunit delta [Syntrophaceae bacterium]